MQWEWGRLAVSSGWRNIPTSDLHRWIRLWYNKADSCPRPSTLLSYWVYISLIKIQSIPQMISLYLLLSSLHNISLLILLSSLPIKYANKHRQTDHRRHHLGHMALWQFVELSKSIHQIFTGLKWSETSLNRFYSLFFWVWHFPLPTVYSIYPSHWERFWRQFPIFCLNSRNQYCVKYVVQWLKIKISPLRSGIPATF